MGSDILGNGNSFSSVFDLGDKSVSEYNTVFIGEIVIFSHVAGKHLIVQHCWMLVVSCTFQITFWQDFLSSLSLTHVAHTVCHSLWTTERTAWDFSWAMSSQACVKPPCGKTLFIHHFLVNLVFTFFFPYIYSIWIHYNVFNWIYQLQGNFSIINTVN